MPSSWGTGAGTGAGGGGGAAERAGSSFFGVPNQLDFAGAGAAAGAAAGTLSKHLQTVHGRHPSHFDCLWKLTSSL
jgi:hypothetical protein